MKMVLCMLAVLFTTCSPVAARLIVGWPYEKLTKSADLIVVAVPIETKIIDKRIELTDRGRGAYLQGVLTKFSVKGKLKGECGTTITVLHYQLKFDPKVKYAMIDDGPSTVSFETKKGKNRDDIEYWLFLKMDQSKHFVFVSGIDDPQLSVRELRVPPAD